MSNSAFTSWNELADALRDRVGIQLGEVPQAKKFTLMKAGESASHEVYDESILDRVQTIDFALIDSRCFYLCPMESLLVRLTEVLVHHGLIVLVVANPPNDHDVLKQVHQILALGDLELLSESDDAKETLLVFRWLGSRGKSTRPAVCSKPFRYEVADRINDTLSRFPKTKRLIRKTLGW